MATQNITQQEHEDLLLANPNADDNNLVVLPSDEETIKQQQTNVAISENPEVATKLELPNDDPDKALTDALIDTKTTEEFYKQYYNGLNYNKARLLGKIYEDSKMPNVQVKLFEQLGFNSMQEMLDAKKPIIMADNAFTRRNFGDNPNAVFINNSQPISQQGSMSEMTTLVGGTWQIPNFFTAEKIAIDNKFVLTEDGYKKPLSEVSPFDLLEIAYDDVNGYHYKLGNWSTLSTNDVRSFFGTQYGDDPNIFATAAMGILNGFIGKGSQGLGYLAGWLGADETKNVLYNFGRSMNYTSKGIQDEFSAQNIVYNVADGIGQMLPIILAMRTMPSSLIAKYGMTQEQAFNATLWSTRIFMGAEAAGATQDQLIKAGVPEKEAQYQALVSGTMAIGSEMIFPGNFVEKMAYTGKFKDGLIRKVVADGLEKRGIVGITNAGKSAGLGARISNILTNMDTPYVHALIGSFEEGGEEGLENIGNATLAPFQNGMMYKNAVDRQNLYNGSSFYEHDGRYFVKYKDGSIQEHTKKDWTAKQTEYERTGLMLQNNKYLSEDYSLNESIYAMMSTAIVSAFGLPANISQQKKAKQEQKSNISAAILAKHIADNPNAKNEVYDILQEYKANGAFSAYHVDKEGNPATIGSGRMVADDLIDSFMNELEITAQAMKVFGINSKPAMQAYEGDIDLFTQITETAVKIQKINNAIANGIENSIEAGLIDKNETEESLNKQLEELKAQYDYLATPEPNKKHSKAYNEKLRDIYIKNAVYEQRYLEQFAKQKYQTEFASLTSEQQKEIRGQMEMFKYMANNQPGFIDDINRRYSDGIAEFGGHETLMGMYNSISKVLYGDKNTQSQLAKSVFERHNKILEQKRVAKTQDDLDTTISGMNESLNKILDLRAKTTDTSISLSEDDIKSINNEISSLMQNYEGVLASNQSGMNVGKILTKARGVIESLLPDVSNLRKNIDDDIIEANADINKALEEVQGKMQGLNFDEIDSKDLGTMAMGYIDTENLTPEHTNIALDEFVKDPIRNLLYKGRESLIPIGTTLQEWKERTDGDNVQNPTGDAKIGKGLLSLLESYQDFLLIENSVIPKMEQDEKAKEASPKLDISSRSLTSEETQRISNEIGKEKAMLIDRIGKLQAMSANKTFGQNKRHIADVWERYNILKSVLATTIKGQSDSDFNVIENAVVGMIDKVQNTLSTYSDNKPQDEQFNSILHEKDPLSYLFSQYVKSDSNRLQRQSEVVELLNTIESIVIQAEEKLSGKLDKYIHMFMETNSILDKDLQGDSFHYSVLAEEYTGLEVFDYTSDFINKNSEFLIDPTSIPYSLNTAISTGNVTKDKTIQWQILSHLDLVNEMGQGDVPTAKTIYSTFADVMDEMNKYIQNAKAKEEVYDANLFTPTFEQRKVVIEMIVNAKRDKVGSFYVDGAIDRYKESLINRGIYLRGFAGGGKTSIIMPYYTMIMAKLKQDSGNNKFNIQVFAPTNNLLKDYQEGSMTWLEVVMEQMGIDFVTEYHTYRNDDSGKHYDALMKPQADIIIIDEATKMGDGQGTFTSQGLADNIRTLQEKNPDSKTHFVLIGDDSQVAIDGVEGVPTIKNIAKYFAKTRPVTEVHRAKVHQIWKLQEFFRKGNLSLNRDNVFLYNENYGVEALGSMESIISNFSNLYLEMSKNETVTEKDMMIVVETSNEKDKLVSKLKPTIPQIENLIYTLKDWKDISTNDAAGLSSDKVFVYYDYEEQLKINKGNKSEQKRANDIMLTSVSRAKNKVFIVSSEMTNDYNENITVSQSDSSAIVFEFEDNNNKLRTNLRNIANSLEGKEAKKNTTVREEISKIEDNYRNNELHDIADKEILETIGEKVKEDVTKEPKGEKLSNIVFEGYNPKQPEKSIERKAKNTIIKLLNSSYNNRLTDEESKAISEQIVEEVNKLGDIITANKPNTKFSTDAYIRNLLNLQVTPIIANAVSTGYAISSPVLSGTVNGKEVNSTPTILTVVGQFDGRPIVDIYDTVFYEKMDEEFDRSGSRKMMLYTIKAAIDMGYIVNNATLSVFSEERGNIIYSHTDNYNQEYIEANLKEWLGEDIPSGRIATDEMYFSSPRIVEKEFGKDVMYSGNSIVKVISKVNSFQNGNFVSSYVIQENGINKSISSDEFNKLLTPKEMFEKKGFFKQGGAKYNELKAFYNITHHTIAKIGNRVIKGTGMSISKKDQIVKAIYNAHKNKQLTTVLEKDVSIITDKGSENAPYAIVSYYDDSVLQDVADANQTTVAKIKNNGLDFIIQTFPELNYNKDKVHLAEKELFDKFMNSTSNQDRDNYLSQIVDKMNFTDFTDKDGMVTTSHMTEINEALLEMNKQSLLMMWNLNKVGSVSSVIKGTNTTIATINSEVSLESFLDDLDENIDVNEFLKNNKPTRMTFGKDNSFTTYAIMLDGKITNRILEDEKVPVFFKSRALANDPNNPAKNVLSYTTKLLRGLDELSKTANGILNQENSKDKSDDIKQMFAALKESEAMEFIMQNHNLSDVLSKEYLKFAFIYDGTAMDTKKMFRSNTLQGTINTLKNSIKGIENSIKSNGISKETLLKMRAPIYFDGSYHTENMIFNKRVNMPGLYLKVEKLDDRKNKATKPKIDC